MKLVPPARGSLEAGFMQPLRENYAPLSIIIHQQDPLYRVGSFKGAAPCARSRRSNGWARTNIYCCRCGNEMEGAKKEMRRREGRRNMTEIGPILSLPKTLKKIARFSES